MVGLPCTPRGHGRGPRTPHTPPPPPLQVRDLRQLSGGERSFATVCFALALGEFTASPFRAMDEFDVYMDAVNRRVSLASLLQNAADAAHLQFLLLTPQDVAAVHAARDEVAARGGVPPGFLRVITMAAPDRGGGGEGAGGGPGRGGGGAD